MKLFWYFLWCYKKTHPPSLDNNLVAQSNETHPPSIDGTLAQSKKTHPPSIDNNLARAPCTSVIQGRLKMIEPHYAPWFKTFCIWRGGGMWSYVNGKQREMKRWTPAAHALFGKWLHLTPPAALQREFYQKTRDISLTLQQQMEEGTMGDDFDQTGAGTGLDGYATEGWDNRLYYYGTGKSPNRWYHPLQNLTKRQKKAVWSGHWNVDIVGCFPSIWWHEMGGSDCTLPNAHLLHPDHKDEFYKLLMRDFNLTDPAAAKALRVTLTSDYKNRHRYKSGVPWFDALHDRILEDTYEFARVHGLTNPTAHKVFTWLEWCIIERMLEAGEEVLLMHDGIIFKTVDIRRLREAAAPHKLKIERW